MIKKLRHRFFIIYMIILSCFLITILSGIYFIVYRSEVTHSKQIMDMALENNTKIDGINSSPPKKTIDFDEDTITITTAGEGYLKEDEIISYDDYEVEDEFFPSNSDDLNAYYGYYIDFEDQFKQDKDDLLNDDIPDNKDDEEEENLDPNPPKNDWFKPEHPNNNYPNVTTSEVTSLQTTIISTKRTSIPTNERPKPVDTSIQSPVVTEVPSEEIETILVLPDENQVDTPVVNSEIDIEEYTQVTIQEDISTDEESTMDTTTLTPEVSNTTKKPNPPNDFKDSEKEITTEYEGNLARNTIYVRTNKLGEIQRISYQYFESGNNISLEQSVSEIIKSGSIEGKTEIDNLKFRYSVFSKDDNSGYDIIFLDRAIEISSLNRLLIIFVSIGGVGLVVLFGVSWLLASWAVTPIAEAWDKQKQFIADASHELKTPLTVIATNTDVVLSNADDTVQNQSKWLTYIKSETLRMSKLVSDLLYIAKSDVNEVAIIMNEFNMSHTVSGICLVFETVAFENGKLLDTDIDENILFKGDEDRIKQLVTILIDNAIVHSEGNANIIVSLKKDIKDKIKLSVINTNGEDIPKGYEERLFERFFRVDKARNRSNGSHGLGLNIAKSIVNNHGGTITVTSTNDHVVTFTVTL